jgi:hypothetical protein
MHHGSTVVEEEEVDGRISRASQSVTRAHALAVVVVRLEFGARRISGLTCGESDPASLFLFNRSRHKQDVTMQGYHGTAIQITIAT